MPPTGAGEHDLAIDKIVDLGMYLCMDIQPMVGGVVKCLYTYVDYKLAFYQILDSSHPIPCNPSDDIIIKSFKQ